MPSRHRRGHAGHGPTEGLAGSRSDPLGAPEASGTANRQRRRTLRHGRSPLQLPLGPHLASGGPCPGPRHVLAASRAARRLPARAVRDARADGHAGAPGQAALLGLERAARGGTGAVRGARRRGRAHAEPVRPRRWRRPRRARPRRWRLRAGRGVLAPRHGLHRHRHRALPLDACAIAGQRPLAREAASGHGEESSSSSTARARPRSSARIAPSWPRWPRPLA